MGSWGKILMLPIIALILLGSGSMVLAADKDVINYRQNIMKSIGANAGALGAIMQNKVSHAENLALHAEAISIGAQAALKAFEDEVVGGTAKAEVWENWKDFSDRFNALAIGAAAVAEAAREGGMAAAGPKLGAMLVCKACHDIYRTK